MKSLSAARCKTHAVRSLLEFNVSIVDVESTFLINYAIISPQQ